MFYLHPPSKKNVHYGYRLKVNISASGRVIQYAVACKMAQNKSQKDRPKEPTYIRSLCRVSLKQSQGLLSAN